MRKLRTRAAAEERQQRLQQGLDPELQKRLTTPAKPDEQTVRMHELTHAMLEPWRLECALRKGASAPRSTQHVTNQAPSIPVIQIDHRYLKDDGDEAKEIDERFSTTLAAVDCDAGVPTSAESSVEGR